MPRFVALLCLCFAAGLPQASSQFRHRHMMMVVSKGLPGITLYDADTEEPICRTTVGASPQESAFSISGQYALVPVYGSSSVGEPGTDEHALHFIRTLDCKDTFVLDTGANKRPHGIVVGNSGTAYLTTEVSKSVLLIDPDSHAVKARIPTDSPYSHMLVVTRNEKKLYVSDVQSKEISVLDVPDRKVEQMVPTGCENQRIALSPDERWFVTNLGPEHKIAFFRTADNKLDFTIDVEGTPFVAKFSVDSKYLYDAGTENGEVKAWKIDWAQKKVVATSGKLGTAIGSLAVSPFNREVYVSDSAGNTISELDPETWKVVKTMPTEKTPDAIVFKDMY